MREELLKKIYTDEALYRAVSDIVFAIVNAYEKQSQSAKELERKIDLFLDFIPALKEPFLKGVEVKVGDRNYPLSLGLLDRKEILNFFEGAKGKWVIAVDESQHSGSMLLSNNYFFRGSLAYGMKLEE